MALRPYEGGFELSEVPLGTGICPLAKMIEVLRQARPRLPMCLEMITRDPLKVPYRDDGYWASFGGRDAARIAAFEARVLSKARGSSRCRASRARACERCRRGRRERAPLDGVRPRDAPPVAGRELRPEGGQPDHDRPRPVPPRRPPRARHRRRPRPRPRDRTGARRGGRRRGASPAGRSDACQAGGARDRGRHGPARAGLRRRRHAGGRGRAAGARGGRAASGRSTSSSTTRASTSAARPRS